MFDEEGPLLLMDEDGNIFGTVDFKGDVCKLVRDECSTIDCRSATVIDMPSLEAKEVESGELFSTELAKSGKKRCNTRSFQEQNIYLACQIPGTRPRIYLKYSCSAQTYIAPFARLWSFDFHIC